MKGDAPRAGHHSAGGPSILSRWGGVCCSPHHAVLYFRCGEGPHSDTTELRHENVRPQPPRPETELSPPMAHLLPSVTALVLEGVSREMIQTYLRAMTSPVTLTPTTERTTR